MILDNATLLITLSVAVLGFTLQFLLLVLMMVLAAAAQAVVKARAAAAARRPSSRPLLSLPGARTTIHGARRLSTN